MTPPGPAVKSSTPLAAVIGGLGARLKSLADARGPAPGTAAFASRQPVDSLRLDLPANTVVDINELLGRPAIPARKGGLGTGGVAFPSVARERNSEEGEDQLLDDDILLTTCSTAPRRWALLEKVRLLCRPADPRDRGPAVCGCGYPADTAETISIHLRPGEDGTSRAGVSGIYRCKSPWLCPVCAVAAAKVRSDRVERAVEACYGMGGCVVLVTLTAHHSLSTGLAEGKRLIADASRRARSGRDWITIRDRHSVLGVLVGQEVTISRENGWHYHQHVILFISGSAEDAEAAGQSFRDRYTEAVKTAGGRISRRYGVKVEVASDPRAAADYTSKGSMAWEIGGGLTKTDTKATDSLTPWQLAERAHAGEEWAQARWAEYVEVMPGTRSCVLTASLRKALGLPAEEEADDEADGEQQFHEGDDVVGVLQASTWRALVTGHMAATFLARVEYAGEIGFDDVAAWATAWAAAWAETWAAKAQREESRTRREEEEGRARRRAAAIEAEARRLIEHGGGRVHGRTLDSVRLAAENVSAVHPDVDPVSVAEMLAAVTRLRAADVAAAALRPAR